MQHPSFLLNRSGHFQFTLNCLSFQSSPSTANIVVMGASAILSFFENSFHWNSKSFGKYSLSICCSPDSLVTVDYDRRKPAPLENSGVKALPPSPPGNLIFLQPELKCLPPKRELVIPLHCAHGTPCIPPSLLMSVL